VADGIVNLDFGDLGYLIVGLFLVAWLSSLTAWELGRKRRATQAVAEPTLHPHEHAHDEGNSHRIISAFEGPKSPTSA
jgi:high-affinity nickel-transport protein